MALSISSCQLMIILHDLQEAKAVGGGSRAVSTFRQTSEILGTCRRPERLFIVNSISQWQIVKVMKCQVVYSQRFEDQVVKQICYCLSIEHYAAALRNLCSLLVDNLRDLLEGTKNSEYDASITYLLPVFTSSGLMLPCLKCANHNSAGAV